MPSATLMLGSFLVAIMVGLTGMGGGALLSPMLMLVFGVPPAAAVSSDLVVSAITKPIAALVHVRRGSVNLRLAGWLSAGSVPGAFLGGLLGWWLGPGGTAQVVTTRATGVVLVAAAASVLARGVLPPVLRPRRRSAGRCQKALRDLPPVTADVTDPDVTDLPATDTHADTHVTDPRGTDAHVTDARGTDARVSAAASTSTSSSLFPTILIGIVAGLAVGVTSTGSGALVIAALAVIHPALPARRLAGTDLAQAVPMVLAGALAHLVAGDVRLSVTAPLITGGVPGVVVGSLLAARVPGGLLRPVLGVVVLASGLSLLGVSPLALSVSVAAIAAVLLAAAARHRLASRRLRAAGGIRPADPAVGEAARAGPAGQEDISREHARQGQPAGQPGAGPA